MKNNSQPSNKSPELLVRNEKALAAWNQFYETCSFFLCDENNCMLLCNTVFRYFKNYVYSAFPDCEGKFDESGYAFDFAKFFEDEIEKHQLSPANVEKTDLADETGRKRYKDFVWTRARAQPDSPLKAIRGLMLRNQKAILLDVAVKFLRQEISGIDIREGRPGSIVVDTVVSDAGPSEDKETSIFDREKGVMTFEGRPIVVDKWLDGPDLSPSERKKFRDVMLKTFSTRDFAIYISSFVRMMSHETLLRACKLGISRINDIWKNDILGKKFPQLLHTNLPVDFDTPPAHRMLRAIAEKEVEKAPEFSDFLKIYREKITSATEK